MKQILSFLKTTATGGVLVLVPLLIMYIMMTELLDITVDIATSVTSVFPDNFLGELDEHMVVAFMLLFSAAFLMGLTLRSSLLRRLGRKIEEATLGRLTIYVAIKRLSLGLLGGVDGNAFQTGLVTVSEGVRQLAYIVEDHGEGLLTVFIPISPVGLTGSIWLLDESKVERLPISVGAASQVVGQMGVGLQNELTSTQ